MKKTLCDRCGNEQNINKMPDFIKKDGFHKNEGHNKLTVKKLIKRKIRFFWMDFDIEND